VIAQFRAQERSFYTVYSTGQGYVVRFHGTCQFLVSPDGGEVACEPGPGCDEELLGVLLQGTVSALLLSLRGYGVLHGSAVRWEGETVLFAGYSSAGKTTMAALCCAVGAQLVTDDVVPLTSAVDGVVCSGLSRELRLRESAEEIAALFPAPGPPARRTIDGRLAICPQMAPSENNRVAAVVLPRPSHDARAMKLERVPAPRAALHLLANARVPAMVPVDLQRPYFEVVTELAGRAPVTEATVPWGPPFSAGFIPELLTDLLSLAHRD